MTARTLITRAEQSPRHSVRRHDWGVCITAGRRSADVYIRQGRFCGAHHSVMRDDSPDTMTVAETATYLRLT